MADRTEERAIGHTRKRSREVLAVLVQAAGAASTFAVVILITNRIGLDAQGRFSLLKAWSDTATTALMFGFPQLLLHLAYHGNRPMRELQAFAIRYSQYACVGAAALAALSVLSGHAEFAWVILAAPLLTFHGLVRPLVLRRFGSMAYAAITVTPPVALLLFVLLLSMTRFDWWGAVIFMSAAVAAAVGWRACDRPFLRSPSPAPNLFREATAISVHAFVQNLLAAAQFAVLLSLARWLGGREEEVGRLAVALVFAQIGGVAAALVAPSLYDHFRPETKLGPLLSRNAKLVGGMALAATASLTGTLLIMPWLLDALFSVGDADTIAASRIGVLAGLMIFGNRLAMTLLQRLGRFSQLTVVTAIRVGACVGMTSLLHLLYSFPLSTAAALSILCMESVAMAWALRSVSRRGGSDRAKT